LKKREVYLNIKVHSVVCYSPINVNRNAEIQFVCNPVDINRTITRKRMQFNAYSYIFVFFKTNIILKHRIHLQILQQHSESH